MPFEYFLDSLDIDTETMYKVSPHKGLHEWDLVKMYSIHNPAAIGLCCFLIFVCVVMKYFSEWNVSVKRYWDACIKWSWRPSASYITHERTYLWCAYVIVNWFYYMDAERKLEIYHNSCKTQRKMWMWRSSNTFKLNFA